MSPGAVGLLAERTPAYKRGQRGRAKRDDFSSNRHPALAIWWSMIFFRKPVPTFRDHALTTYPLVQVSVPLEPRSVRRSHLPESEPSALMRIMEITVRPLIE